MGQLKSGWEQKLGTRLTVWAAALAFVFAAFYLVMYFIENDLLGIGMRLALSGAGGVALTLFALWLKTAEAKFANAERMAAPMGAAGLAILYASVYATTSMYALVPPVVGVAVMAAATLWAAWISRTLGHTALLFGIAGAFMAPVLVEGGMRPDYVLTGWLLGAYAVLSYTARKQEWWGMMQLALFGALFWVAADLYFTDVKFGIYNLKVGHNTTWIALTLLGALWISLRATRGYDVAQARIVPQAAALAAIVFGAIATTIVFAAVPVFEMIVDGEVTQIVGPVSIEEAVCFALLLMAGLILALRDTEKFGFLVWAGLAASFVVLFSANSGHALFAAALVILFMVVGVKLQAREPDKERWAWLTCAAAAVFWLTGFLKQYGFDLSAANVLVGDGRLFWFALAVIVSLFLMRGSFTAKGDSTGVEAFFSATMLGLGFYSIFGQGFLHVALAGEVMLLSWAVTRRETMGFRAAAAVLLPGVWFLLWRPLLLFVALLVYALCNYSLFDLSGSTVLPRLGAPVAQLAVPAVMLGVAAWLFGRKGTGYISGTIEASAVVLSILTFYFIYRAFADMPPDVFFAGHDIFGRGVVSILVWLAALVFLRAGDAWERPVLRGFGFTALYIALCRTFFCDMLAFNPLGYPGDAGAAPFFNALLVGYGLPVFVLVMLRRHLIDTGRRLHASVFLPLVILMLFVFVSLNIRQLFHGASLHTGATTVAEIFAYSVAWIVYGACLLAWGIRHSHEKVRICALLILLFSVGKVFIYDASVLDGLYRVFSFLGLGVALVALGHVYARFTVSDKKDAQNEA